VVVLDTLMYGDASLKALDGTPHLQVIPGDFRDIATVVSAMQGVDAVVHLGAIVGDPACAVDEKLTISINVAATRMNAEVARGAGVRRFVFASTCSVYGQNTEILDEKSDLSPVSLYARSKIASEEALLALGDAEFSVTVLRFATLFGLSARPRFDLVVNVMTAMAVRERRILVMAGEQWRPFLHVADAAEAIVHTLATSTDAVGGEILNVGSDAENYRLEDVGQLVAAAVPGTEIERRAGTGDRRNYRVSFRKFHTRVGFLPKRTVREGIAELADALEAGVIEDFRDPRYSNHRTITDETVLTALRRDDSWERLLKDLAR
jgi:nucleoside-diphosphate-sugar epimerase